MILGKTKKIREQRNIESKLRALRWSASEKRDAPDLETKQASSDGLIEVSKSEGIWEKRETKKSEWLKSNIFRQYNKMWLQNGTNGKQQGY